MTFMSVFNRHGFNADGLNKHTKTSGSELLHAQLVII